MQRTYTYLFLLSIALLNHVAVHCQQSIGIGTTTPDSKAALDISSTTKGVLFPRLNAAQLATLQGLLTPAEAGMMVTDASTGKIVYWGGSSFQSQTAPTPLTAAAPLSVATNRVSINPGTAVGDLITWDGNNWVNMQPAPIHFNFTQENRQPFLAVNYCISLFGIFPSQTDATQPFVGEIFIMGCSFPPLGFASCNGQLLSIAENDVLFALIGTTYGGDGETTFAVPDLQGRVAIQQGQGSGLSNHIIGQAMGTEQKTITH